jgi:lysophospholipase L1-like esterase
MVAHDLSDLDKTNASDPYTFWCIKPNLSDYHVRGRCWGRPVEFTFSTNDMGLRNPPIGPKTKPRVLALGDSTTFGLGLGDSETWPRRLGAVLNDSAEVINGGVAGFSAFQGLRFLDKKGLALKPDVVVASFGQNDFDSWNSLSDIEIAAGMEERESKLEQGSSLSDAFVLARRAAQGVRQSMNNLHSGPKRPRLNEQEFADTLIQFTGVCKANSIRLLFVVWPAEEQVTGPETPLNHYQPVIVRVAQETNTPFVDLVPAFRAARDKGALFIDPVHASALGCDVAAAAIASALPPLSALE